MEAHQQVSLLWPPVYTIPEITQNVTLSIWMLGAMHHIIQCWILAEWGNKISWSAFSMPVCDDWPVFFVSTGCSRVNPWFFGRGACQSNNSGLLSYFTFSLCCFQRNLYHMHKFINPIHWKTGLQFFTKEWSSLDGKIWFFVLCWNNMMGGPSVWTTTIRSLFDTWYESRVRVLATATHFGFRAYGWAWWRGNVILVWNANPWWTNHQYLFFVYSFALIIIVERDCRKKHPILRFSALKAFSVVQRSEDFLGVFRLRNLEQTCLMWSKCIENRLTCLWAR